ncbi:hypothetical protein BD779DRAFT_1483605 [Infundibulicybe gibba]|nr:hypothetical protein BD779DRAFT_1483605 [Infundibulicybe gibba]
MPPVELGTRLVHTAIPSGPWRHAQSEASLLLPPRESVVEDTLYQRINTAATSSNTMHDGHTLSSCVKWSHPLSWRFAILSSGKLPISHLITLPAGQMELAVARATLTRVWCIRLSTPGMTYGEISTELGGVFKFSWYFGAKPPVSVPSAVTLLAEKHPDIYELMATSCTVVRYTKKTHALII